MGRPRKNPVSSTVSVSKKVQSLEGLSDIISETDIAWKALLHRLMVFSKTYGFHTVELPLLEDVQLYQNFYKGDKRAGSLVTFPIGSKQAAVRPELLPSVLRAYAQGKVYDKVPLSKWMTYGQVVGLDVKTQKLVSDTHFGFEVFGTFNHLTEAQAIGVVWEYLKSFGLTEISLEINSIGNSECQVAFQETLHGYFNGKKYQLCDDCSEHLSGRVLNILRCENLDCQAIASEAPTILDFLDEVSHKHFTNILEALDELSVPYQLSPTLVGTEGHSKTNVAIKYKSKGASITLGEGGYHESLMESVGGKNLCCFGFYGSLQNIRKVLDLTKTEVQPEYTDEVFLVPLGELAAKKSLKLFRDLTSQKISVYDHFGTVGVKNQLKQAETFKAPVALIIGQKEALDDMVILRDVKSGMQEIISYDKIVEEVKKRLGR